MGEAERVSVVVTLFNSYLGGTRIESRPAHPISWLRVFVVFVDLFVPRSGHCFPDHPSHIHSTLHDLTTETRCMHGDRRGTVLLVTLRQKIGKERTFGR
jgi:hypothetical protein